jgi:four helix bundle protein
MSEKLKMRSEKFFTQASEMNDKPDILNRSFQFGVKVIKFVRKLPRETVSTVLGNQLVRSATSIAANTEEAQAAVSKADFSHKMGIALKEAREANLWLRFINDAELVETKFLIELLDESTQIKRILGSISKKVNPFTNRNILKN